MSAETKTKTWGMRKEEVLAEVRRSGRVFFNNRGTDAQRKNWHAALELVGQGVIFYDGIVFLAVKP